MEKHADAYRTIGEAAEMLSLPQHVLRFWETRFSQIRPMKRSGGRRYYRPEDLELLAAIKHLLYGEGYTIKGVQRILKQQGAKAVVSLVAQLEAASAQSSADAADAPASGDIPFAVAAPANTGGVPPVASGGAAPAAGPRNASIGLAKASRERLEAVLGELGECSRILENAKSR